VNTRSKCQDTSEIDPRNMVGREGSLLGKQPQA